MVNGVFICDFVFGNVEPTMNGGKWIMAPNIYTPNRFCTRKKKRDKNLHR